MKTYWTMRNGNKIDIDEMDINHLRNTLKMLVRNTEKKKQAKPKFQIQGEIAQEMIFNELMNELMGDELDEYYNKI
jgi:predicted RNA-binding protein with RPS1 domain